MRRFGIELELVAPRAMAGQAENQTAAFLTGLGLRARTASYSGRDYTQWQVKHDGSLRPEDRGCEIVAPIMPALPDSYEIISRVVTALDAHGYVVNRTCGMHVHVNVSDLPVRTRQLIVLRYNESRADYDSMMPASRRMGANGYCAALSDRPGLERAINRGDDTWRRGHGRHSEVVNTAFMYDTDARLEFRQAAGSCDAAKVVAWVKYLQEMIDEVARRAQEATFAMLPMSTATAPVRPVAPLATVPRMHVGSDAYRAMQELTTHGVVTTAWAAQNGIVGPVLRRIIVGFRRHGAGLRTVSAAGGPEYYLSAVTAPCTMREVFAPVAPAPAAPAPVTVAPTPVATTTAAAFVQYDFFAGLSTETATWVRSRRDTFTAENPA
jgi:hypothetical protein